MEGTRENKVNLIHILSIVISNILVIAGVGFFKELSIVDNIKNIIMVFMLSIAFIFTIVFDFDNDKFLFNNKFYIIRFLLTYLIMLVCSAVFSFLPIGGWLFLVVFITLALFSSVNVGIVGGTLLLAISSLLAGASGSVFIEYLIPGIIGIVLFSSLDAEFLVIKPLIISVSFQLIALLVYEVLIVNRVFSAKLLMVPVLNIILCVPLLLFVLKIFSYSLLYQISDRMEDIIDPEFELLAKLRENSKEKYDISIFTAVLCSKIAVNIGIDERLCKAVGYYHSVGVLCEDNSVESTLKLLTDYKIPETVIALLREYLDDSCEIKSKEVVVLLFAETMISSIRYMFSKNKEKTIEYDKLVDTIIDKNLESGLIKNSKISYEDMNIIRNTLIGEKLFYDFMR